MPSAVLVPQTALLLPGVAGLGDVLCDVREAAVSAVASLVAAGPTRIVVIAPAARSRRVEASALCTSLLPLGVPERWLGWPAPCRLEGCPDHESTPQPGVLAGTATSVGLRLLAQTGWDGETTVVETALRDGEGGVAPPASVDGFLVLGSLSARHGAGAPRAADPRADDVDALLAADLAAPSREALDRLAGFDAELAADLDVGGAAAWSLLARSVPRTAAGRLEARDDLLGVDHAVWTWRWER